MKGRIVTLGLVAASLVGCVRRESPDPVEQLTAELSKRQGASVDVVAIERMKVKGHSVVCGFYASRPPPGEPRAPLANTYASVDGTLVSPDRSDNLVGPCLVKVHPEIGPPIP